MKTMMCDVCKKEINWKYYKVKEYFPSFAGEIVTHKLDVCDECWQAFNKWLKKKGVGK